MKKTIIFMFLCCTGAAWAQTMRADTLTVLVTGELQLRIELIVSEDYIKSNRCDIDAMVACWERSLNKVGWYSDHETHSWATLCASTVDGENIYRTSFSLIRGVKKRKQKNIKLFITRQEYEENQKIKTKSRGHPGGFSLFAKS